MSDDLSRSTSSMSLDGWEDDARVLCGKRPSSAVASELLTRIQAARPMGERYLGRGSPCLAVILVGDRKDSRLYIRIKKRMAATLGIEVRVLELDEATTTPDKLRDAIRQLNRDETVDGLIVQVPLPEHLPAVICQEVAPEKDVDGFNSANMGKLALQGLMQPLFSPCTPRGVLELLRYHRVELAGRNVVVLGRSAVVGLPLSLMLLAEDATVTLCHSKTAALEEHTRRADVVICAMGRPGYVKGHMLKHDAVVVDVGVSVVPDETGQRAHRIVGDVDALSVLRDTQASITPVPGGVGPMTVIMLMKATVEAFERRLYAREMLAGEH